MEQHQNKQGIESQPIIDVYEAVRIIRYGTRTEKVVLEKQLSASFVILFNKLARKYTLLLGNQPEQEIEEAHNDTLEAFFTAAKNGSFDPSKSKSVTAYLYTIFERKLIDRTRQSRRNIHESEDIPAYSIKHAKYQSVLDIPGRLIHLAEEAIRNAEEKCRATLELTYFEGWKTHEIAAFLNLAEQTVKGRLSECSKKLRDFITKKLKL